MKSDRKIEYLDNPEISKIHFDRNGLLMKNLGLVNDYYTCYRPSSKVSCPYIKKEDFTKKTLISNFGHVGGGWTLNWGSVMKALELMDLEFAIKKNSKIAVIGGGIIGSSTVSSLIERGVNPSNITIYTENLDFKNTAAFGSGAIFSAQVKDPTVRKDFDEILLDTFKFWMKIREDKSTKKSKFPWHRLSNHFEFMPFYTGDEKESGFIESDTGIEPVIEAKLLPNYEKVKVRFSSGKEHNLKKVTTLFFHTYDFLKEIYNVFIEMGVGFQEKRINNINNQISEELVFNCCGAGSKFLDEYYKDSASCLAGHMIHLNKLPIDVNKNLNYVLLSKYKETKDSEADYFIFMPKKGPGFDGVLGGTKIPHYYGGNKEFDMNHYYSIIKRARHVYGDETITPKPKF